MIQLQSKMLSSKKSKTSQSNQKSTVKFSRSFWKEKLTFKLQNSRDWKINSLSLGSISHFWSTLPKKSKLLRHLLTVVQLNMQNKLKIWKYCSEQRAVLLRNKFIPNLPFLLKLMCLFLKKGNILRTKSSYTQCWRNIERVFLWVCQQNSMKKCLKSFPLFLQKVHKESLKIQTVELKSSCLQHLLISCRKIAIIWVFVSGH